MNKWLRDKKAAEQIVLAKRSAPVFANGGCSRARNDMG